MDERMYEMYMNFSKHIDFESEFLENYEKLKKDHDYAIARKQLSRGLPEKVIAKAFQFTPDEMKMLKMQVKRASCEAT